MFIVLLELLEGTSDREVSTCKMEI